MVTMQAKEKLNPKATYSPPRLGWQDFKLGVFGSYGNDGNGRNHGGDDFGPQTDRTRWWSS